jgi:hypothetical protein
MLEDKIKLPFKRRRSNKIRYSADKMYINNAELKHTNTKLTVTVYVYNKQKLSLEQFIRKVVICREGINEVKKYINRLLSSLKNKFYFFKGGRVTEFFLKKSNNILNNLALSLKPIPLKGYKKYLHDLVLLRKGSKLEQTIFNYVGRITFNKLKYNDLLLNFYNLGLKSIVEKIYAKTVEIKLVELKSIHLNSDVFASAVALKLRDRYQKPVNVLRKAILQMTKIPDLHTIRTFDDHIEQTLGVSTCESIVPTKFSGMVHKTGFEYSMVIRSDPTTNIADNKYSMVNTGDQMKYLYNNNNLNESSLVTIGNQMVNISENDTLNVIKQQAVSGVRFEASGRLTRRLTAMRAVFKYRYNGSLKNLRSSLNSKPSTILRGYVKSNSQYTIINSKTRNGSFGLKG